MESTNLSVSAFLVHNRILKDMYSMVYLFEYYIKAYDIYVHVYLS